jgi:dTMP kinase
MSKSKGFFVCVEGLDASGKTTQAKLLTTNLRRKGFDAVYTTEPSGGQVGRLIRSFVLNREERVPIALEALLFAADRVDHVEGEVKPLLKQGKVVVCDRYVYSSLAYQGAAGLDVGWIEYVNRFALTPDQAILIDVPTDIVLERLKRKKTVMENKLNLDKVRQVYLKLAEDCRLTLLDGNRRRDEVAEEVSQTVSRSLKAKRLL